MRPRACMAMAVTVLLLAAGQAAHAAEPDTAGTHLIGILEFAPTAAAADTTEPRPAGVLEFTPVAAEGDTAESGPARPEEVLPEAEWLRPPFGERLLTEPEAWQPQDHHAGRLDPLLDYNRVDLLRAGLAVQVQDPATMAPRLGARLEYATGRRRSLYGIQLEQPLLPRGRLALGVSMSRRTDHSEMQQVEDVENSLALLFARQDYRDYFERDGFGAYLAWRVPDFSVVSVHLRNDTYRSLVLQGGTRSLFERDHALRDNPAVDEGDVHALLLRLERQTRRTSRTRAGLYHWIELERAGAGLGGDFGYTRAIADVRSVLRLSPATTLVLRAVGGHTAAGTLPAQKQFTVGGVDGLRAHAFSAYRGDQVLLAQAEYTAGLWHLHSKGFESGLHVIAFVDAGRAWNSPSHEWDPARQTLEVDGGFGLANSEDNLRVYVARNLRRPRTSAVFSVRLQRPF